MALWRVLQEVGGLTKQREEPEKCRHSSSFCGGLLESGVAVPEMLEESGLADRLPGIEMQTTDASREKEVTQEQISR